MTINWDLVINGLLVIGPAYIAWILFGWLYDRAMYRRVEKHASEQWRKRHAEKEKHDGWMG